MGWSEILLLGFNALLALFTFLLWDATRKLWKSSERQIAAAHEAASAARISANAASVSANAALEANAFNLKVFAADQRPWLVVEITGAHSPLASENGRLKLAVSYRLYNIGKTPATRITWFASCRPMLGPYSSGGKLHVPAPPPHTQLVEICKGFSDVDERLPNWGQLLFPSESKRGVETLEVDVGEFKGPAAESKDGSVLPLLFVCANYGFSFDESAHQTALVYAVFRRDPTDPSRSRHFTLAELPIPASDLVIKPYEPSSGVVT
jgi:hypothetical protein